MLVGYKRESSDVAGRWIRVSSKVSSKCFTSVRGSFGIISRASDHMINQQRDVSIDVLRILCCLMVIAIHATPEYESYITLGAARADEIKVLLVQAFVRGGLPIFFMISGMYILNSEQESLHAFYKKRLLRIIVPFLVFGGLHFFILGYRDPNANLLSLTWGFLSGLNSPSALGPHFWFVYSIIGLYLISPLVSLFLKSIDSSMVWKIILGLLVIKAYNLYSIGGVTGIAIPDIDVWLLYFLIGGLLVRIKPPPIQLSLAILLASWMVTCLVAYIQAHALIGLNLRPFDCGLNMYAFSMSACLIFLSLQIKLPSLMEKIVIFVSKGTYGIFLIHVLVLFELGARINFQPYKDNIIIYSIMISGVVFVVSFLLSSVIDFLICNRLIRLLSSKRRREEVTVD